MKRQILAVDDEPHMLRLLERIITEKTEYEITTTGNSLEVPEILGARRFDVIISDLKMPGWNGLDILRYIKENDRDELVLIITAFGSLDSATEALSQGVFDYITKPFKKEKIINTIDRAMSWQICRREAKRLGAIFDRTPFADAVAAFEREYVMRLAARYDNDTGAISEVTGLPEEKIEQILGDRD